MLSKMYVQIMATGFLHDLNTKLFQHNWTELIIFLIRDEYCIFNVHYEWWAHVHNRNVMSEFGNPDYFTKCSYVPHWLERSIMKFSFFWQILFNLLGKFHFKVFDYVFPKLIWLELRRYEFFNAQQVVCFPSYLILCITMWSIFHVIFM